jgi:hypothetical protein
MVFRFAYGYFQIILLGACMSAKVFGSPRRPPNAFTWNASSNTCADQRALTVSLNGQRTKPLSRYGSSDLASASE